MKITVVIVTFNGAFWIEKNIKSILKSNYSVAIIVVDNNSDDRTLLILEQFSDIEIIKSNHNLGFGKANNLGIQKALQNGSDAVFLLNQDTWIFENTISNLVHSWIQNQNFGILSPLHYSNDTQTLDANFENYYNKKYKTNTNIAAVPFVNAAAWLISKKCLEKVGGFEPIFSHYGEDRNFCNRVLYHKFDIGIVENSKIIHDRIIFRNFSKDNLQARFIILNSLLNINNTVLKGIFIGFKSVFGLSKYFFKYYNLKKTVSLFFNLFFNFVLMLFHLILILKIRKNAILGISGIPKNQ